MTERRTVRSMGALARACGVTQPATTKWLKHPAWCFARPGPGSNWDVDEVEAWRKRTLVGDANRPKPVVENSDKAPTAEEAAKQIANMDPLTRARLFKILRSTERIELDIAIRSGQFMRREDVDAGNVARIGLVKAGLLGLANRVRSQLAPLKGGESAIRTIENECRRLLDEFSRGRKK